MFGLIVRKYFANPRTIDSRCAFQLSAPLPLHPTSTQALANYARVRDAL